MLVTSENPVAVIGLDAATFDVIGPWIEDGTLPTLSRLIREGSSGSLRSTIHPISPVAWASAVTGQNPGRHGIFDWRERCPKTYHAEVVSSESIRAPTIWQIVNAAGYTAGVVNVPLTYPPTALSGYLVSGILTPAGAKTFTYPAALSAELHQVCDGYRVFLGETYREGEEQRFLDALQTALEKRRRVVLHLLQTRPTDLTFVVFMESDHVQHDFWKYMDPSFPGYRAEYGRHENAIRDVFVALDSAIGEMLAVLPPNTITFVISDHGAGPLHKVVYIEKCLIRQGFMQLNESATTRLKRCALKLGLPRKVYQGLTRLGIDVRQRIPKKYRTRLVNAGMSASDIDWSSTQAYSCGDFGQIAINLQGRERLGSVPPSEYEAVRAEIIAFLRDLRDPETGEFIVDQVYRREEIYDGPYLEAAPDILFSMQGYSYITSRSLGMSSDALMEAHRFGRSGNSGSHTMDGIFVAYGPHIRVGQKVRNARLIDLAPTLLYAMGLPVIEDMEGRVLNEIFTSDHLNQHPVKRGNWEAMTRPQAPEEGCSDEDSREIYRRLRDLGYLD